MDALKEKQFVELYNQYYESVFYLAFRYLNKDIDRAHDITQETFCRLYKQNLNQLKEHMQKWLYAVCRNLCFKFLRKNKILQFKAILPDDRLDEKLNPLDAQLLREDLSLMMKCIPSLTDRQRQIVHLKFFENATYVAISKKTNMSKGNVGFQLNAAMVKLKHEMVLQKKKEDLAKILN